MNLKKDACVLYMHKAEMPVKLAIPCLLAGILFLMIYLGNPSYYTKLLAVVTANFLDVISGEITAIIVGIGLNLNPLVVVSLIIFIESDISLFVAWNFDILKTIPKIGRWLIRYEDKIKSKIEKKKWAKTAEFYGLVLMAAVPFYGTGALASTVVGRLLGMGWKRSWLAVTIGVTIRSVIILIVIYFGYTVLI